MSSVITLYDSRWCGFCRAARHLLVRTGWEYAAHSVDGSPDVRAEMESRRGRHTVPQIFFGDTHVGGFDDMAALDADGELDALHASLD